MEMNVIMKLLKVKNKNNHQPRILDLAKLSLKNELILCFWEESRWQSK